MSEIANLAKRQYKRNIGLIDIYDQNQTMENLLLQLKNSVEQSKTIYKKTYEESKNERINFISKKLIPHYEFLNDINGADFDDTEFKHDLIFALGAIMKICQEIIDTTENDDQENKYVMRLSIIVHDLIKKVKAERFTKEVIDILNKAIFKIINGSVTRKDVVALDTEFMDKGLNWIIGG